jgi:SpoVK/Ycf46/Vps4 family AAA+-type ATPase
VQIPLELQKHIIVIEHQLPNAQELNQIAKELTNNTDDAPTEIIDAAAGLTRYEAEGAFALSLVRHKKLNPDAIWEIKANTVKKSKTLTLHRNGDSFKKIGGLNGLKAFCLQAMASKTQYAKGVLLLGVPGTGKSAFAKALGSESGRPTLTLDLGALMGSLVGQTEANIRQALKIADAMQPCILFVDEIEKALAGSTSSFQGDSGVSARMLGTLLTWLNDHQSNVFFIGTCNDISKLPTEFTRAERFDAVWFLDLPTPTQREAIWNIYLQGNDAQKPDDTNWTGAEIASCCRLAAMLNTTLQQAAQYVIPVAVTAEGRINDLRDWATNRCLDAETGQVYKPNASKHTRRVYK